MCDGSGGAGAGAGGSGEGQGAPGEGVDGSGGAGAGAGGSGVGQGAPGEGVSGQGEGGSPDSGGQGGSPGAAAGTGAGSPTGEDSGVGVGAGGSPTSPDGASNVIDTMMRNSTAYRVASFVAAGLTALSLDGGNVDQGSTDPSTGGFGVADAGPDAASLFANAASPRPVSLAPPSSFPTFGLPAPAVVAKPTASTALAGPSAAERQAKTDAAAAARRKRSLFGFGETHLTGPLGLQSSAPLFQPMAIPGLQLGQRLGD